MAAVVLWRIYSVVYPRVKKYVQVAVQVLTLAFLVVGGSVAFMIPIMLYVLDLYSSGWRWQYVCLFVSMLASTDAVAIIATMKSSAWPCHYINKILLMHLSHKFTLTQVVAPSG